MTFPVSQHMIREQLREAKAVGERCLAEFVECAKKGKGAYCINWGDLSLLDVCLCFDEDGAMTLIFEFEEGDCNLFRAHMWERLVAELPNDFSVEVRIEW